MADNQAELPNNSMTPSLSATTFTHKIILSFNQTSIDWFVFRERDGTQNINEKFVGLQNQPNFCV